MIHLPRGKKGKLIKLEGEDENDRWRSGSRILPTKR
jgi:hypothetical protein